ncbi:MAG: tRNA-binding protein [Synergistales bacterium]|nr:tRNA-binding protein [Synergistales bacterium]
MRVGKIIKVDLNEKARKPAFIIQIDLGPEMGVRKSSAQLKDIYSPKDLLGKQVICVVNFPPKRIAGFSSEVLILGVDNEEDAVVILQPEREVPLGKRIY